MRRNKKQNTIIFLVILFLIITMGYSLMSTTLKINGNSGVKTNTWDIHWDRNSLEVNNKSVSQDLPQVSQDNKTITYGISFTKPGDFYEFTVDAVNAGTVDGMISVDSLIPIIKDEHNQPKNLPTYLKYSVTYADGVAVEKYHLLAKQTGANPTREKYKVRIEFDKAVDEEDLPETPDRILINTEVPYSQADDNAEERPHITKYTITLNPNGGEVDPTEIEVNVGSQVGTLPTPTRTNYIFDGWYTALTEGTKVTSSTVPTGNDTYYAHWIATIDNITVTPSSVALNVGEEETLVITGPTPMEEYTITSNDPTKAIVNNNVVTGVAQGTTTLTITGTTSHETITVNVTVLPPKYTITLNPNQGEVDPTEIEVNVGSQVGTLPTPTRTNYIFDGWYTALTEGTKVTSSTVPTGNDTYYAHWIATIDNITVTPSSVALNVGEEETLVITGPTPMEEYTITSNDPTKAIVNNNVVTGVAQGTTTLTITGTTSHETITVNVTVLPAKYIITLNPNDGEVDPTEIEVTPGQAIGTIPTPTKTNNTFDGWHTELSGGILVEEDYIPQGDMTIYAYWYPSNKVAEINGTYYDTLALAINAVPTTNEVTTIRLLKNTTESLTIAAGKNIVLNLNKFTVNHTSSNVIKNSGTLKLYNGTIASTAGSGAIDVESTGKLETTNMTVEATGSRQAIYNNGGRVTIKEGTVLSSTTNARATLHNLNNGTVNILGGEIISNNLYAVYNESGTLNIGSKDGIVDTSTPLIQGKTYGVVANSKYNFYDGTIKGQTYHVGTATTGTSPTTAVDTNETKVNEIEELSEKVITEDGAYKVFYLHQDNKFTITLDPNEGTVTPTSVYISQGSTIGQLPVPIRRGYIFNGWYTETSGGTQIDSTYIPQADITIHAQWTEKSTNTVVLDANGGTISPDEIDVNPGSAVGTLPTPTREGYRFLGWYTLPQDGVKVESDYIPSAKITIIYARWNNFPTVFKQEGACEFNGSGTITGTNCTKYIDKTYIDTGVSLYSSENYQNDYEIGFTIETYDPSIQVKQATFVNTKVENQSINYPGLVFRRENETNKLEITQTISGTKITQSIDYTNVTSVKIARIDGIVYYAYNNGELQELQDMTELNQPFNITTWFGAAPANAQGTSAQRYLNGTLSNMYIKLGTYEDEDNYRITFNANGGEVDTSTKTISQGDPIGTLPLPTWNNHIFNGWYTDLTDGTQITSNTIPNGNLTYYAHWTEDN